MVDLITLNNKDKHKLIHDIVLRPLKINSDETGVLVETMRTDWTDVFGDELPFAMQYYSITKPGIARDEDLWHFHPTGQQDRFLIPSGEIVVAVADKRDESPTKGLTNLFHMKSDENPYLIVIPKRTLHGFMVVSQNPGILLNFPTRLYNPAEEGRVPYAEANMQLEDGRTFNWNLIREHFGMK